MWVYCDIWNWLTARDWMTFFTAVAAIATAVAAFLAWRAANSARQTALELSSPVISAEFRIIGKNNLQIAIWTDVSPVFDVRVKPPIFKGGHPFRNEIDRSVKARVNAEPAFVNGIGVIRVGQPALIEVGLVDQQNLADWFPFSHYEPDPFYFILYVKHSKSKWIPLRLPLDRNAVRVRAWRRET